MLENASAKEYHRSYLYDETQETVDYIILKSRLNDLALANFEFAFYNMSNKVHPYEFIDKIVATRHYFTHYAENKKSKSLQGDDLGIAYSILRLILSYYLLKEIGFEHEYIKDVVGQKQANIEHAYAELLQSRLNYV